MVAIQAEQFVLIDIILATECQINKHFWFALGSTLQKISKRWYRWQSFFWRSYPEYLN
jgi:hypothetical protein